MTLLLFELQRLEEIMKRTRKTEGREKNDASQKKCPTALHVDGKDAQRDTDISQILIMNKQTPDTKQSNQEAETVQSQGNMKESTVTNGIQTVNHHNGLPELEVIQLASHSGSSSAGKETSESGISSDPIPTLNSGEPILKKVGSLKAQHVAGSKTRQVLVPSRPQGEARKPSLALFLGAAQAKGQPWLGPLGWQMKEGRLGPLAGLLGQQAEGRLGSLAGPLGQWAVEGSLGPLAAVGRPDPLAGPLARQMEGRPGSLASPLGQQVEGRPDSLPGLLGWWATESRPGSLVGPLGQQAEGRPGSQAGSLGRQRAGWALWQ
ncbi:hypothetical protein JZ751_024032, partial [Albula glossodonta]